MAAIATEAEIRALVPEASFKRGKEIFTTGKLHDTVFEGDLLENAAGVCSGSKPGDSYSLTVTFDPNASKPVSNCPCPVGRSGLCKHAIALLLQRVKELQGDSSSAADEECGEVVENPDLPPLAVARNPRILPSNPTGKRVLPEWMTAPKQAVEKPAKGGRKKAKIENEEEDPQPSGRKSSAKRKGKAEDGNDDEASPPRKKRQPKEKEKEDDEDEEDIRPKRTSRRSQKKQAGVSDEEDAVAEEVAKPKWPRRAGQKKVNDDDVQQPPQPKKNISRGRRKVQNDEKESNLDLTTADLLSMAQKHLNSDSRSPSGNKSDSGKNLTSNGSTDEKAAVESIRSSPSPSKLAATAAAKSAATASAKSAAAATETAATAEATVTAARKKLTSPDSVADEMFGLMFGGGDLGLDIKKSNTEACGEKEMETRAAPPVAVVPKPKKKGSLKERMALLL